MQSIICEAPVVGSPKNVKKLKDKIRFEAILQTCGDINRNRRIYDKKVLQEGIDSVMDRVKNREFMGEISHPISDNPSRQMTVLYQEASHLITDLGWRGNKLVGVLETLRTPNGNILKALIEDQIPVGWSFRGAGEIQEIFREGQQVYKVQSPIHVITWDSVSYPSHSQAKITKITESVSNAIYESVDFSKVTEYKNGMICTESGVCYLPNDFDKMVEIRKKILLNKFSK